MQKIFSKINLFFQKTENVYLVIVLVFGLFMAVFNPPFTGVPDEQDHYWKAWSIANGYFWCTGNNVIPKSAENLPKRIEPVKIEGINGKKIALRKIYDALIAEDSNKTKVISGAFCTAMPFGYLPQALGLNIGRIFHFSPLLDFYLARLFNLLLVIAITFWAIRIIPFGKIILLLIGLLPMTVQQIASLSYDGLHISLIFLFLAYILKLAAEKEVGIGKKEMIFLFLLSLIGFNIKPGYFVLSLLVFLLPINKFRNKKTYWFFVIFFVSVNIIIFLIIQNLFRNGISAKEGIDVQHQMLNVIHDPLNFIYIAMQTFYKKIIFFIETFIFKPGWLNDSLSYVFYLFAIFGLIILIKNEEEKVNLTNCQRWILLGTFLACFFVVFLSLYAIWTKVGAEVVSGVQGRYFLSIFPILVLSFYKSKFNFLFQIIKNNRNLAIIVFLIILFIFSFQKIYQIHYDKNKNSKSSLRKVQLVGEISSGINKSF